MGDVWTDRLSEYLDDDLQAPERAELEAHLGGCEECASLLNQLRLVRHRADELEDRPPEMDLWPGIEARIRGLQPGGAEILDIGSHRARGGRRFQFTLPQLVAAGIALMVVSAGGVWLAKPAAPPVTAGSGSEVIDSSTAVAVLAGFEIGEFDAAVRALERILQESRDGLDPGTVTALERSLATIDRAISEAHEALRTDPTNTYLSAHLASTMSRKIRLLQHAASLTTSAS